jgi:hypothetical protein
MTHVGRPFTWREGVGITLLAFALTVYFTWPLALRPHELGRLALGDGQFSVWNVAWVAHALSTGADVFDANIFHPHKTTLAYSEANLGAGTLALPAYLLTGNPYAAHNSAVLVGLTFSVIGMYLLARRLTGNLPASLVAAVSVIIVLPFFLPYIRLQDETGFGRTLDDAGGFSADWRAYFASSAFAHSWMLPLLGQWKEVLFPGFSALILGTFGAVMSLRRRPRQDGSSSSPIGRDVALFYLIVFVLALWSSFGPSAGLYTLLHHTVPVFSLLRAPARFGLAVTLVLSVFSAAGLTLLLARSRPTVRTWLAAAVMIFAVAELSTRIPYDTAGPVPRAYKVLAAAQRGAVVELPFYYLAHERYQQTRYMIGSTSHWQPLVNGYSDFIPPDFFEGAKLLENFPDEAGLKWLRARDTRYVLFHLNLYDEASRARLDERIAAHASQLQPRYLFGLVHIYELVDVPSSP